MTTKVLRSLDDIEALSRFISARGSFPITVTIKDGSPRSVEQNSRLWAFLADISSQVEWYGQKLSPEDWKDMFTASLRKSRVVPGIDPGSFVVTGLHTSKMTKPEFSALMELITAFGTERGVVFCDMKD